MGLRESGVCVCVYARASTCSIHGVGRGVSPKIA